MNGAGVRVLRVGFTVVAATAALAGATVASAEEAGAALQGAGQSAVSLQAQPASQGPMSVERVENGFVIAPDFKVSKVDGHTARIAGLYGGWTIDNTLLIGGAGYWLTNGSAGDDMGYGGLVVQWTDRADRNAGFGARSLVGLGHATLTRTANIYFYDPMAVRAARQQGLPLPTPSPTTVRVRDNVDFFVFEPQLNGFVNLGTNARLTGGIGYRVIGDARGAEDRLRGAVGSISLEIGSFGRGRHRP